MTFSEQLNKYIEDFESSPQDLVKASGLSAAVISRYRNGDRTPQLRSTQLDQLANGLYQMECSNNLLKEKNISKEDIYNTLALCLNDILIDYEQLSKNFNELISTLNISLADLARFIGYDASFLSKIRTGNRFPSKPKDFVEAICNFVVSKYKSNDEKIAISLLINCSIEELDNQSTYALKLSNWLSTNSTPNTNYIDKFLNDLDEFDLNKYIKAIHFDEMKVPFVPFYKASSKTYYGIEEMKKGELDFFKATVLSKSNEPVFMCSDMPMEDMAKDIDFGKKWMYAIAISLKKGLHLNVIHNINRPFNEMMLGLESWIPIYMTGQVSPYYLKGTQSNIYYHLNYTSGVAALTGECIDGYHNDGKYFLTTNKNELSYYKTKADCLLKKASPLMKIYRDDSQNSFNAFLNSSSKQTGKRRRILSSLPIHTISDDLLKRILLHNNVSDKDSEKIFSIVNAQKNQVNTILENSIFEDNLSELSKEDFEKSPVRLFLADGFYDKKICYNYDEYLEHLAQTKEYSKNFPNYTLNTEFNHTFKNIQVLIFEKNWVMISKDTSPSIHFVIHHPKLRNAIENFIPPVVE